MLSLITFGAFAPFWAALIYEHRTSERARALEYELATDHAKKVAPLLAKEKRFEAVQVSGLFSERGMFRVHGFVEVEADLQALSNLISSTHPPVAVAWQVQAVGVTKSNANH